MQVLDECAEALCWAAQITKTDEDEAFCRAETELCVEPDMEAFKKSRLALDRTTSEHLSEAIAQGRWPRAVMLVALATSARVMGCVWAELPSKPFEHKLGRKIRPKPFKLVERLARDRPESLEGTMPISEHARRKLLSVAMLWGLHRWVEQIGLEPRSLAKLNQLPPGPHKVKAIKAIEAGKIKIAVHLKAKPTVDCLEESLRNGLANLFELWHKCFLDNDQSRCIVREIAPFPVPDFFRHMKNPDKLREWIELWPQHRQRALDWSVLWGHRLLFELLQEYDVWSVRAKWLAKSLGWLEPVRRWHYTSVTGEKVLKSRSVAFKVPRRAVQLLICPLTKTYPVSPAVFDGRVYEYQRLLHWVQTKGTHPVTEVELKSPHIVRVPALRFLLLALEERKDCLLFHSPLVINAHWAHRIGLVHSVGFKSNTTKSRAIDMSCLRPVYKFKSGQHLDWQQLLACLCCGASAVRARDEMLLCKDCGLDQSLDQGPDSCSLGAPIDFGIDRAKQRPCTPYSPRPQLGRWARHRRDDVEWARNGYDWSLLRRHWDGKISHESNMAYLRDSLDFPVLGKGLDLSFMDLRGRVVSDVTLRGVCFTGCELSGSKWVRVNFEDCDFTIQEDMDLEECTFDLSL